jgi:hypothetical protein
MKKYIEKLQDWYLDKKTGTTREVREYESWLDHNVNRSASRIRHMFGNFRHVLIVNPKKFFDYRNSFEWAPCRDVRQYMWPERALGDNMVWLFERVNPCAYDDDWEINGIAGDELVFVATNNDSDAVMLAIKYS